MILTVSWMRKEGSERKDVSVKGKEDILNVIGRNFDQFLKIIS